MPRVAQHRQEQGSSRAMAQERVAAAGTLSFYDNVPLKQSIQHNATSPASCTLQGSPTGPQRHLGWERSVSQQAENPVSN